MNRPLFITLLKIRITAMDSPQHTVTNGWIIIMAATNGWTTFIIVARRQVDRKYFFIGFPIFLD